MAWASVMVLMSVVITADAKKRRQAEPEIKYVFYMIGDGMGINHVYGAQFYNKATGMGPESINFLGFPVQTVVTTRSVTSFVTDSAAGGTAMASGFKTNDYYVGVDSDMNPVSSVTEWAKAMGYGTGIATTVGINHATPAAFYAHQGSRNKYADIIDDYIGGEVDFLAGGGIYNDRKRRLSSEELEKKIADSGITILRGEAMERSEDVDGRLLCMGETGLEELLYAVDQDEDDTSLSDFVDAGIDYLDGHYGDKGFFFMIEGGKIDYANHSNDAVGSFNEINDFAAAIDLVLEFYNEHPEETLIVVSSDHETGGLILGSGKYRMDPDMLAWQKASEAALTLKFVGQFEGKYLVWDEVKAFLSDNLGLWSHVPVDAGFETSLKALVDEINLTGADVAVKDLYSVNSKIIYDSVIYLAKTAGLSWAHSTHTGSPVGLYVLGPGAEAFYSCRDNADIPRKIAEVAGYRIL